MSVEKVSSSKKSSTSKSSSSSSASKSSSNSTSKSSESAKSPSSPSSVKNTEKAGQTSEARKVGGTSEAGPARKLSDGYQQSQDLKEETRAGEAGASEQARRLREAYGADGPNLASQGNLKGKELERLEAWQDKLGKPDRNWYNDYLGGIKPEQRDQALRLFSKVDDSGVQDPRERSKLRRAALDEAMKLNDEETRHLSGIDLNDKAAEESAGAAYNPLNHRLSMDTSLLDGSKKDRTSAIGGALDKLREDRANAANPAGREGRELAHGMELGPAYRDAVGRARDRQNNLKTMQDMLTGRGYRPEDAADRADTALKNRENYHNGFRDLFTKGDDEARKRLGELNPRMADLIGKEQQGSLPTNQDYVKNLDLNNLARQQGIPADRMRRFDGWQNDTGKAQKLQDFLGTQAGVDVSRFDMGVPRSEGAGGNRPPEGVARNQPPQGVPAVGGNQPAQGVAWNQPPQGVSGTGGNRPPEGVAQNQPPDGVSGNR
ncbi:MAG: hypothetical protein AB1758_32445, partial [Candidatus Eremiobacterota bacterium]